MRSVHAPTIVRRHPSLRWFLPVGVAAVAVVAATGMFHSTPASTVLPQTTPRALLAAVSSPDVSGFSGTVVSHVDLGLPEIPAIAGGAGAVPLGSLLSGSHTLQVWYGGPERQRIALLGSTDETDLFRSGRQLWQWSSADRVADRARLPKAGPQQVGPQHTGTHPAATHSGRGPQLPASASTLPAMTPSGAASAALAALDPSTRVSVVPHADVADRSVYDLILRPRDRTTRIGAVHIAVDGQTKIPLAVSIYPRGSRTAAIDISFSSIRFVQPPATYFDFTPPAGARVHRISLHGLHTDGRLSPGRFSVSGSNWSTVLGYDARTAVHPGAIGLGRALTPVSGRWGAGRLLETNLVCALITRDGRVYAGAVDPSALYAAAGRK